MTVPAAVRAGAGAPGYPEICENIRRIEPAIRAGIAQMEEQRRLPEALVAELRGAGAFRLAMPAEWGGPDLTPAEQTQIIEQVSRIDASVGWCVMIGMDSGIFARYLEPGVARQFFPRLDTISAGWITPAGRAHEVEGGYRVEGRWKFGSGCTHADVMVAGCTVRRDGEPAAGPGGRPLWRLAVVRPEQVTIHDTWHTTGLVGTGSCGYSIEDVFVPHLAEQWEYLSSGRPAPQEVRAQVALGRFGAFRAARDVIGDLYDLVGASALYKSRTPLDRAYRDIATACQHLVADSKVLEQAGQLLFGSEPDYQLM